MFGTAQGAGSAILTFLGGFHPQTAVAVADGYAHHHLAIAVFSSSPVTSTAPTLGLVKHQRDAERKTSLALVEGAGCSPRHMTPITTRLHFQLSGTCRN